MLKLEPFAGCREQELVGSSSMAAGGSIEKLVKKSTTGWRTYARQEVFIAAVALALLYLTVMSFVSLLLHSTLHIKMPFLLLLSSLSHVYAGLAKQSGNDTGQVWPDDVK